MKQWYEELFENYALSYDQEKFTRGTLQEVDFIEQEIGFDRSFRVLLEISWLLASLGFQKIEIYGCAPGQFNKHKAPTPNDYEMLVMATC